MSNPSSLQSRIESIAVRAAHEIAAAVRVAVAEQVRDALGAGSPARSVAPPLSKAVVAKSGGSTKASAPSVRKTRRGVEPALLDNTVAWIAKNPGKRAEELRNALGFSPELSTKILAKLRVSGRVRTEGNTRLTRYFSA